MQSGRYGMQVQRGGITFADYLDRFIAKKKNNVSAGTYEVWYFYVKILKEQFKQVAAPLSSISSKCSKPVSKVYYSFQECQKTVPEKWRK